MQFKNSTQFERKVFDELRTCFECDAVIPAGTSAFLFDSEAYCCPCVQAALQDILAEAEKPVEWPEEIDPGEWGK